MDDTMIKQLNLKKKIVLILFKFSVLKLHYNNGEGHLLYIKHSFVNLKGFL